MANRLGNWMAAVLAWVIGTALVAAAYLAWARWNAQPVAWNALLKAAGLAGLYAAYLGWRFRPKQEEQQ